MSTYVAGSSTKAKFAMGAAVQVDPEEFRRILGRSDEPVVVKGPAYFGGDRYLTSYKGILFHTKSKKSIQLPRGAELVEAKRVWVPSAVWG